MTVIVIIVILAALISPIFSNILQRARAAQCAGNLKSLYIAANGDIQDNHQWPQIRGMATSSAEFASAWLKELQPYGIQKQNWLCPTIKVETHYTDDTPFRLDYIPTPFGSNPVNPFLWPNHPWFSERGSVHGQGNLIIMTNGSIKPLNEITGTLQSAPE